MSFYLKPPKGMANLHVLQECVHQRLNCFDELQNDLEIEKFVYLIEDSILDRAGHFIFRLAVLGGSMPSNIFIDNELKLLKTRMKYYDRGDMQFFLKNILKQLRGCIRYNIEKKLSDFYWTLYNVVSQMLEKRYLSHIFQKHNDSVGEDDTTCDGNLCISIPFWFCNTLIGKREMNLKNGNVLFECHQWKDILPSLYESYLKIIINEMKFSRNAAQSLTDDRISVCLKIISSHYPNPISNQDCASKVQLENLVEEAAYFPLCMKNLYDILHKKHRLSHNDRFDLSVFLKGVGLSLNDSIKFWEDEYTKQHSECSKCSHSWQENERKYIYGIRHLYGLEGSRKNYSVRTCNLLQENGLGINCEGGCPFVHYDDDNLRSVLRKNLPGFEDDIEVIILERKESANFSCKLYGDCILKKSNVEKLCDMNFGNPLQYYNQLKNI